MRGGRTLRQGFRSERSHVHPDGEIPCLSGFRDTETVAPQHALDPIESFEIPPMRMYGRLVHNHD